MKMKRLKLPFQGKIIFLILMGILVNLVTLPKSFAEASQDAKLLFLGNKNIAPVVYLDNDTPSGVAVDIVRALAEHIPEPIEIKAMDWSEAQDLVARGEADALIQINPTEERKIIYDFSDPLLESRFSIFTTADRVSISGISSLNGLRVGVEAGGLPQRLLENNPHIQLTIIPDFFTGFKMLNESAIDAVVVDYRVGAYILAENKIRNIKVTGEPIAFSYSSIAIKKGNAELLDAINNALRIIQADGTYQKIIDKWEPKEAVFLTLEQITQRVYHASILILLILALIAVLWMLTLYKQLIKRKAAEEKLAKVFQLCPDAITISRMDGTYTDANEGFTLMSGYFSEEAVGKKVSDMGIWVEPKDRDRMVEGLKSQGEIRNLDTRFRRKDGIIIQGMLSARVVNINGEPHILAYVRDVTEKRRDEACEAILHHVSTQILAEVPLNDILSHICEQLVSVFDLSLSWISWKKPDDTVRIEAKAGVLVRHLEQVASRREEESDDIYPAGFVLRTVSKLVLQTADELTQKDKISGLNIDWEDTGSCAVFPLLVQGKPICGLGLISRHERFWDERMLARLENFANQLAIAVNAAQNRERLNLLRTGLETAANAIWIADKNGNIEWVNSAFVKLSGYDYSEIIGRNINSLAYSFSDLQHVEETVRKIRRALKTGNAWHGELNLWRKDGSCCPSESTITAVRNDQGEIVNSIGVHYDISERKRAQEAVQTAKEAKVRAEKFFSLGALSAGICHEINQPLNSIKMIASGISYAHKNGRMREVEEIISKIEEISRQADRINSIVSQLRSLMRQGGLPAEPCDLNESVWQSLSMVRRQLTAGGIHVKTYLEEGLPRILAMTTALEEIIGNLLVNAIQALDTEDKLEKTIVLSTYSAGDVILTVNDNGPGISKEAGRKIFEPLFSGKSGKDNLGLGLTIVNSLVTSFGGTIIYESGENGGTTFAVRFPAAEGKESGDV